MSSPDRTRRWIRGVAAGLGLGLVVTGLTGLSAAPAQAADPVTLQLLNINDFHGRIDANTTKFATTVETLRAANPNTLLLSAGDNVGASLFASNVAQDAPTIDVLDALGLQASAVGNHEFDKGFADLTGRIDGRADWTHLGANVYQKGTQTPALPEYATFETGGVTVAVIGAVTQETATAVSPAGIATLDFGDPVEAVNRVAGRLSDGSDANGEADVIVAEYHEGAEGDSSLADELARDGGDTAFADIVNDTVASVDVIFTGHTHAEYAWDAPVDGGTRPLVQTGSYGANIGQVTLTYDPDADTVTSYDAANVPRVATANPALPRVAAVQKIVDAALAQAAKIGNQVVGRQAGDVTTAHTGGGYTGPGGTYVGGTRDDRTSESTLGNLVAEALLAGAAGKSPDFAVTNPGGLRAELLAAGDTSSNPANTDGVVTLAEAAAVLPFANTLSTVELTGEQVDLLFEQQWPIGAAERTGYLQLGVSSNLRVTADPSRPEGDRITSIRLNGTLLDPAAEYTVSTLNFLAAGGDDFSAFTQGTATDIGLLDLDVFTDHLKKATVRPDFARQQVEVSGTLPATVAAGDQVDVDLADLDLTSQGSPANTRVKAFAVNGSSVRELGTFPVTGGAAAVELTVPADLVGSQGLALIAEPSRTLVGAALPQLRSTTTATVPKSSVYGRELVIPVSVASALEPTGRVRLMDGGKLLRRADLVGGKARFRLNGRLLKPGYHRLQVVYVGDGNLASSAGPVTRVGISRAVPRKVVVAVKQKRIVARRTKPRVVVRVRPPVGIDVALNGTVRIKVGNRVARVPLVDGRAIWRMPPFRSAGRKRIVATFIGAGNIKSATGRVVVRVKRR